jgi:hypothetical protein
VRPCCCAHSRSAATARTSSCACAAFPILNPELAHALTEQFGVTLDADAFVALAEEDGSFKPNKVIDRLRGLTSHLEWFNVQPRLVVSSFVDVSRRMREDAAKLEHPVLDALAGNPGAKWTVGESYAPVEPQHPDDRALRRPTSCCWTRTPSRRT